MKKEQEKIAEERNGYLGSPVYIENIKNGCRIFAKGNNFFIAFSNISSHFAKNATAA